MQVEKSGGSAPASFGSSPYLTGHEPIRGNPSAKDLAGSEAGLPRIVTYSDRWDPRVWRMLRSARLSGWIPGRSDRPIVVGYGQPFGGFVDLKITKTLEAIADLPDDQMLLLIDGSDILVNASPETMTDIHASFGVPTIVSSNPDCNWNGGGLKRSHPNCVNLNAGAFMGPVAAVREVLTKVQTANHDNLDCKADDQCRWYAAYHSLAAAGKVTLDTDSKLFSSISPNHRSARKAALKSGLLSRVPVLHIPACKGPKLETKFKESGHTNLAAARLPVWNEPEDPIRFVPAWPELPDSPAAVVLILDSHKETQAKAFDLQAREIGMNYTVASGVRPDHLSSSCPRTSGWVGKHRTSRHGTTLAHMQIHEAVAAGAPGTENGVILFESDNSFAGGRDQIVKALREGKAAGLCMLLLGSCAMKSSSYEPALSGKTQASTNVFKLNDKPYDVLCGHAYWFDKSGATQMLATRKVNPGSICDNNYHMIKSAGVVIPNLAYQNIQAFGSTSKDEKSPFVMANPYACVIDGKSWSKYTGVRALVWYIVGMVLLLALAFGLGFGICRWRK